MNTKNICRYYNVLLTINEKIKELALKQIDLQAQCQRVVAETEASVDSIQSIIKKLVDQYKDDVTKNYIFKASVTCTKDVNVRFQLMTPGAGYPVDEDVPITAGVEKLFTKEFTGYALVNAKLLLDFGWTQGDNQVLVKDIVIAETAE